MAARSCGPRLLVDADLTNLQPREVHRERLRRPRRRPHGRPDQTGRTSRSGFLLEIGDIDFQRRPQAELGLGEEPGRQHVTVQVLRDVGRPGVVKPFPVATHAQRWMKMIDKRHSFLVADRRNPCFVFY
jgi:hypothetical protein